jgi:DNA-binding response OmpR family regulator
MQKRLLVVDDDDEIRELLEFDLSQSGYLVDTEVTGMKV